MVQLLIQSLVVERAWPTNRCFTDWMRGRNSAGTDASGWRSKDPYSLYRALNGTKRAELEKFASDYDKLEDRMGKKYHIHFCEAGDNDCEKKLSHGRGQNFEDAFEGGCLNSADHEKLRMLKQTLDRFLSQELTKYHCRREFDAGLGGKTSIFAREKGGY